MFDRMKPELRFLLSLFVLVATTTATPVSIARPNAEQTSSRGAQTWIYCGDGVDDFLKAPKFCSTLLPNGTIANSIALHELRWSHWGHASTTAVGRTKAKDYDPWRTVRVRAYRRIWSECVGTYVYTRLRTTTKYGRHTWSMPDCN